MRAGLNNLILKTTASLTDAEVFLRKIPNDDPVSFADLVLARIRAGDYQAQDIFHGDEKIGVTVFFVESFGTHRELVSVATYTNRQAPGFMEFWNHEIRRVARSLSCVSIRMSTVRHGLVSLALKQNWQLCEVTLRLYL